MVSEPQWTLGELYSYYLVNYHLEARIVYLDQSLPRVQPLSIKGKLISVLKKYRPLLETYILMKSSHLSIEFKGRYRESEVFRSVNLHNPKESIDFHLLGAPTLKTITNIDSSIEAVSECERKVEAWYNNIITQNRK